MTEPLVSTPRMLIDVDRSPAPPWAGQKYSCWRCRAEIQLEAADKCERASETIAELFHTPACPMCNYINLIRSPQLSREETLKLLKIGLEPEEAFEPGYSVHRGSCPYEHGGACTCRETVDEFQVANPS